MGRFFSRMLFMVLLTALIIIASTTEPKISETYIIHMDPSQKPDQFTNHELWHQHTVKSLSSVCPDDKVTFLYSYTHVMNGFSAKLTPCQITELENSPAHLTTYKESFGKTFTTHTPKFLGLNRGSGIWPVSSYGKDVIIGVIDTGIWPESESFKDHGMSKVPSRWKGKCENGTRFSPSMCNNKLIGARSFSKGLRAAGLNISAEYGFDSPRGAHFHGTHTSSTAAGNIVTGASHFGYAKGIAKGIAPRAHLAMYKVVWSDEISSSSSASPTPISMATDILAGMDQAISDGVDVMSLSIGVGTLEHIPYYKDAIAIASLSAIEKGIVVVCAAGNGGPEPSSIYNGAPWITTVGAGTIDRSYVATVELENGKLFEGISCFPASVLIQGTSLYYGSNDSNSSGCKYGSLDRDEVKRKIVLCDDSTDIYEQINTVKSAGAYGAIFLSESFELEPEDYYIPGVVLHTRYAKILKEYAMAGNGRVKNLRFGLTKTGTGPAPQVAQFSSRGPNPISPQVLKPDILAPGVNVLGAVRPDDPFMQVNNYGLLTDYAFKSGTSMAAPHVAGVAALVRAVHRDWSPAAIRSAIMTTATKTDNTHGTILDQQNGMAASPLDFGAGHVNPNRAMDPGLIYDMGSQDYIDFLCGLGYTRNQMMTIIRTDKWICNENQTELNYPSFILNLTNQTKVPFEQHFTRTVTNVGDLTSTYHAILTVPDGLIVSVEPNTLWFTSKSQKAKFVLTVRVDRMPREVNYGYLEWVSDRNQSVSSPIVIVTDSGS